MIIALDAKTSSGWGRDTLISIEEAVGSRHNDYLGGGGGNDRAYVDGIDTVRSATSVNSPPFSGPDPGPYPG